jgi:hypothetical protein
MVSRTMHDDLEPPTLLRSLGRVCKTARIAGGKRLPDLVAELHRDQSTLYRFEQGTAWPRDVQGVVDTYARVAGVGGSLELWQAALDDWRDTIGSGADADADAGERLAAATAVRGATEALEHRLATVMDERERRLMDALREVQRNTERLARRLGAPPEEDAADPRRAG